MPVLDSVNDGASSPQTAFISSKASFGVESFKYSNLMTAPYSTDSITLPYIRTAHVNKKRIIKHSNKLLCDV